MSQRTIRFKDETEALIEERAKGEGRSFAGWVKRAVEKALGTEVQHPPGGSPPVTAPAPLRQPKKTSGQRTPPRPARRAQAEAIVEGLRMDQEMHGLEVMAKTENAVHSMPEESVGCADCGGDIAVHPEFGRYCTGCGARVR